MSAFIVSEETMHLAVSAMLPNVTDAGRCTEMGRELYAMNQEAVRQRYPDDASDYADAPEYQWRPVAADKVQQFKSLACLLYQCGEGDVDKTRLYKRAMKCKLLLAAEIVYDLPAYDRAVWDGAPTLTDVNS